MLFISLLMLMRFTATNCYVCNRPSAVRIYYWSSTRFSFISSTPELDWLWK